MRVRLTSQLSRLALLIVTAFQAHAAVVLPLSPEQNAHPYPVERVTQLRSADQLIQTFEQDDYCLKTVLKDNTLPRYFVENLPRDLNHLPVEQKVSGFIRLLLPTIVAVNEQLLEVRKELIQLSQKPSKNWSPEEQRWVGQLRLSYGIKSQDMEQLLLQVDVVPIGMVLAQAIDESGWGTSYFATIGNNLYGEHLSSRGGKYLTTPGGHVKVSAFDNLYAGTASYMHNLNSTRAYKKLWEMRRALRQKHELTGYQLVGSLVDYSTRGEAYVENLRALIKHHDLDRFDHVVLDERRAKLFHFASK
ncbi:glucosaminidase domain-containing protein [Vibrio alfacsensis]|uniref:glucosaminidase domain-containing protein n=1 Tax=Vibrio alfacsensis TaxID=1074311 RepID=UPI002ADDD5CA|nr:glucosaminidase domain-containing protein [Vibrio alfacsensis]WQE78787.1 glucosaminidase domain-containing protein [Vibrio alfacsensis]